MGSPGHIKIPGRFGKEFKPRRAFTEMNEYYRKKISTRPTGKKAGANRRPEHKRRDIFGKDLLEDVLVKAIGLFLAFLLVVLIITIVKTQPVLFVPAAERMLPKIEERSKAEKDNAYEMYVQSGKNYIRGGYLDRAQVEFTNALSIYIYGQSARIGLTQVLLKKCQTTGTLCEEAEEHLIFLREMKYISETELNDMIKP